MKTLIALAAVASLALNAILIALAFRGTRAGSEASSALRAAVGSRPAAPAAITLDATAWPALDTDDLPALVERLRRAGFPPRHVHAIVAARVEALFAARRKTLQPERERLPFWKNLPPPDPKLAAALDELRREQSMLLHSLLGEDANRPDAVIVGDRRRALAHLSAEKAEAALGVLGRYDEMSAEIHRRSGSRLVPEDREKLGVIDRERRAALERILTPQELTEYELRASPTANQLRGDLAAFRATEEEFRALFALQRPFDERFNRNQGGPLLDTAVRRDEYSRAREQLLAQIAAALGPARFADYERASDLSFQRTSQLVSRLELPTEAAVHVWSVRQDIQQRVETTQRDRTLSPEQARQQLTALADEAIARITTVLGPRGFEAYQRIAGEWLQALPSRPPPAAQAAPTN